MAANAPRSIRITVVTPGTPVQGFGVDGHLFTLIGHPDNTGTVYVGDQNSVALNGYPLTTDGNQIILQVEKNLSELWFDADTGGDIACVIRND